MSNPARSKSAFPSERGLKTGYTNQIGLKALLQTKLGATLISLNIKNRIVDYQVVLTVHKEDGFYVAFLEAKTIWEVFNRLTGMIHNQDLHLHWDKYRNKEVDDTDE